MAELNDWDLRVARTLAEGNTRIEAANLLTTMDKKVTEPMVQAVIKKISRVVGGRNTVQSLLILQARGVLSPPTDTDVPPLHPEAGAAARALHVSLVSCLNWREFRELRAAYEQAVRWGW